MSGQMCFVHLFSFSGGEITVLFDSLPMISSSRDGSVSAAPPGRYKANPWGFHDMHGNVAEWTSGEEKGARVSRGGSFWNRPVRATAEERRLYLPHQPMFDVGFRLCWTPGADDFKKP